MLSAILYQSQTGSCERYARMLSAALHLPLYPADQCPARQDGEVLFVTWVMAGKAVGLKKLQKRFRLGGLVQVGMSPVYPGMADKARAANGLDSSLPVFCRQGGFHMNRLPLPQQLAMRAMNKTIAGKLSKKSALDEAEKALYGMARTGDGEPPVWDVSDIAAYYTVPGGGLKQP